MLRKITAAYAVVCLLSALTMAQSLTPNTLSNTQSGAFALQDSTPVKLRISRNLSSADARTGDQVDFEVLEEVRVNGVLVIAKGGTALGTVTEGQAKRRMGRGGKLDVNIDYVRLADGEKAPLRAVKEAKGGGHTGAMTAGIVATSLVVWPAAPFFLFMHGKDITIPKGTEISAYISGDTPLDLAKFQGGNPNSSTASLSAANGTVQIDVASTPAGADIEIDGRFVGNTPSSVTVAPGDHEVAIKKNGFTVWDRKMTVSSGRVNINAELSAVPK